MLFAADQAPTHWCGAEWLAAVCEGAGLTVLQAEAAKLLVDGCSRERFPPALSVIMQERMTRKRAEFQAWQAGILIRRSRPDLAGEHRRQARELLACHRNRTACCPPVLVYPEHWGVVDREPVRLKSRLEGEHPDDLVRHPLRFLRDLGRLRRALCASGE
jgi:hypothetical protein